jgi:hypothetical protein
MLLTFDNGDQFASGAVGYSSSGSAFAARLILEVEVEGRRTEAIIDTAAPFLICSPELAEHLGADALDALIDDQEILIRGIRIKGRIHRINLTILATAGTSLSFDVTAFVPDASKNFGAAHPAFLGYGGCLEWIRFAVDPSTETFYFGPRSN